MSAKLIARPYTPDPEIRLRRMGDLISESGAPGPPGQRGSVITGEYLAGLQRDLNLASDAVGGYLKKSTQPVTVIDYLNSQTTCVKAGAQTFNPRGNYSARPVVATVGAAAWVDVNGGSISETAVTFASRSLGARLAVAQVDISRQLQVVTDGLSERAVIRNAVNALSAGWDKAALAGAGGNEPQGIVGTSGVNSTSGAAITWATILALLEYVEAANATPSAFVMAPAVAEILRSREKVTDSGIFILGDDGEIAGIPAYVTTAAPASTLIVGDFSKLVFLQEEIEVLVNRYTQATTGVVEVVLFSFGDLYLEHPAAFAVATGVS